MLYTLPFWLLCSSNFLFSASFSMMIPELPAYLEGMGGREYVGLIIALFTLTAGLSRPFSGKLTDRIGRVSDHWFYLIRDTHLDAYLNEFGSPHPLFNGNNEINFLLSVYLLEKAVYELGYEISYRPAWVKIPLKGIIDVIRKIEKIRISDRGHTPNLPLLQTGLLGK